MLASRSAFIFSGAGESNNALYVETLTLNNYATNVGGATVPFIARYRKEMTGGATDEQLWKFNEEYTYSKKLLERKAEILRLIEERGKLDEEIQKRVEDAATLTALEDLYRPYQECGQQNTVKN